jgi:long-subunit fatty acid transport protein
MKSRHIKNKHVKNVIAKSITISAGLLLSATSHANNWLVSVELGRSDAKTGSLTTALASGEVAHLSDSDTSWTLGVGYQLNNALTLEAGYIDLGDGDVTITGDSITPTQHHNSVADISPVLGDGFTLGLRYQLWQHEDISTSVLLGLITWEGDIISTYQAQQITTERDGNDIYYGLEGHYQLTKQWQLSIGFTRYALGPNDVDVIYSSLGVHF